MLPHLHGRPEARPSGKQQDSKIEIRKLKILPGPTRIRTWDQGIMSPLL